MFATRFLILSAAIVVGATQVRGFVRETNNGAGHPNLCRSNGTRTARSSCICLCRRACSVYGWLRFTKCRCRSRARYLEPESGSHAICGRSELDSSALRHRCKHIGHDVEQDLRRSFRGNTLAVTLVTPRDNHLIEADVIFNSKWDWDSYRGNEAGQDFRRVALHEFGHVVGLDHPDEAGQHVTAIMNSVISSVDTLQADDINGGKSIYDSGPAFLTPSSAPNLVNLSTRAFVGTGGNVVIGGFIVQGSQSATVILRGIGNSLPAFGITTLSAIR